MLPERLELMAAGFCFFSAALQARNCSSAHGLYFFACKAPSAPSAPLAIFLMHAVSVHASMLISKQGGSLQGTQKERKGLCGATGALQVGPGTVAAAGSEAGLQGRCTCLEGRGPGQQAGQRGGHEARHALALLAVPVEDRQHDVAGAAQALVDDPRVLQEQRRAPK